MLVIRMLVCHYDETPIIYAMALETLNVYAVGEKVVVQHMERENVLQRLGYQDSEVN